MLPNGGFPPISKCENKEVKNIIKEKDKKGFFYNPDSVLNIRDILKKNLKKKDTNDENNDNLDIFIAKISSNGTWIWAEGVGGSSDDIGYSVASFDDGSSVITGYYDSSSLSFGSHLPSLQNNGNGNADIFIAKISSNG